MRLQGIAPFIEAEINSQIVSQKKERTTQKEKNYSNDIYCH